MHSVEENLELVHIVLNKYYNGGHYTAKRLGIDVEDLFQIGSIGLFKACRDFNENNKQGASFKTYAFIKIRGELRSYIQNYSVVFKYSKKTRQLAYRALEIPEPTPEKIMDCLVVDKQTAFEIYHSITHHKTSLDVMVGKEGEQSPLINQISDDSIEDVVNNLHLEESLALLTQTQRSVCLLFLSGKRQAEIADVLGLTQPQIGRVIKKVIHMMDSKYQQEVV